MSERYNKPRVFLSHSSKNKAFIERLHSDLQKCRIDPWLYSEEIKHGDRWLDVIFEEGIPTCDAFLVYLTEASIESNMVKKEIDAAILRQLEDNRIAFMPYVSEQIIRDKLRADLKALQTPVWNDENYSKLLPQVVSDIWISYLNRTISSAVQDERVKRLELELVVEKYKSESDGKIFSSAEEIEFKYIWDSLDVEDEIEVQEYTDEEMKDGKVKRTDSGKVIKRKIKRNAIVAVLIGRGRGELSFLAVKSYIDEQLNKGNEIDGTDNKIPRFNVVKYPELDEQLITFGFIERRYHERIQPSSKILAIIPRLGPSYDQIWTPKSYRYRFWLAYNHKLPEVISIRSI